MLRLVTERSLSTFIRFFQEIGQRLGFGMYNKFVPFMFSCSLSFCFDIISWKQKYHVINRFFVALMFLNVCSTSFPELAWIQSVFFGFSGCILSIGWNRSSKSSNISAEPPKINVFVDIGFSILGAYGRCWAAMPPIGSDRRLMELFESEFWSLAVCWGIDKILSCDTCNDSFWCWCDGGLCGVRIHPVRT